VRRLDARIDAIQRQINSLDRRHVLSNREADRLRYESNQLERQLHYAARNGLSGWETRNIEQGIYRLEARVQREARDLNRYNGRYGRSGYDRDRDGLDDRYERDHGTNYDEDHDRD